MERIIHHGTPELLGEIDESKYIYNICRCPVDYRYGMKIAFDDLTEYERRTGECHFHCDNCGTDSTCCFRPRIDESEDNKE